jgi:hypothetical protein
MNTHTVARGESPASISAQYTGDPNRWQELVEQNPQIPKVTLSVGVGSSERVFTFATAEQAPQGFGVGASLRLPASWPTTQRMGVGVGWTQYGDACLVDMECAEGLRCINNKCDMDLPGKGEACLNASVCRPPYECNVASNTCELPAWQNKLPIDFPTPGHKGLPGLGQVCTGYCMDPLVCQGGVCVMPGTPVGPMPTDPNEACRAAYPDLPANAKQALKSDGAGGCTFDCAADHVCKACWDQCAAAGSEYDYTAKDGTCKCVGGGKNVAYGGGEGGFPGWLLGILAAGAGAGGYYWWKLRRKVRSPL